VIAPGLEHYSVSLLISAGQVLPDRTAKPIEDGAVLIAQGRIVAVGPEGEVAAVAGPEVRRLHYPGATILAGLIDCHVHLAFDASVDPVATLEGADDGELLLAMAARARQLLECGVTTVRDLGDRGGLTIRLREAVAAGLLPGPRILAATTPLTSPGGHCWFLGGEVEGEQAIRARVRGNAEAGADVIKVMVTGGHLTPGGPTMSQNQFTTAELSAAVDEAHSLGLPVAAHAHGTDGIVDAVSVGVDTMEHCTWLTDSWFEVRGDVVADMVAKGIPVCPAFSRTWRNFSTRFGPEIAEEILGRLRWLDEQGVRLIAGTDAGIPGAVFDDFVGGLEAFEHSGLSRARILELATVDAAGALGLGASTGRLVPGYDADVVVVGGDPLTDLAVLRDVRLVLARGRPHVPTHPGSPGSSSPPAGPAAADPPGEAAEPAGARWFTARSRTTDPSTGSAGPAS
jgi:imidazolonepropionase-like amidohydrolase